MDTRSLLASILIVVAIGMFCVILYRSLYVSPQEVSGIAPAVSASPVVRAPPVALKIPSLSVDAKVQQVGLTKSGRMGIPSNFTDVAWYKYGPIPGSAGNAVIDGHVDNAISLPGVFKHLDSIRVNDEIEVIDASSTPTVFKVTKIESLPGNATSTAEIFKSSGTPGLVLITCSGTWDQPSRQYSQRLIVFATLSNP